MSSDSTSQRGRQLEDEFFIKEDLKRIERLREMKKHQQRKTALAHASGIKDDAMLDRLVELDVHPETVAALALVPLTEVAWADGQLDTKEREAILAAAEKAGVTRGNPEYEMLEEWLKRRPNQKLMAAWTHYVQGLMAELNAAERSSLKESLLGQARSVAESAGGFLGVGSKISDAEQKVLKRLEAAFNG